MLEKITALVFGLLALILEALVSIKTPTIESIVAVASVAVIVIAVFLLIIRERTVTVWEDSPKGNRPVDKALKLASEIAPYVTEKDGKITLKIVK